MKKVLVIEDDAELLQGLKDNLEIEGYEVETAIDGHLGMMQVVRTRPDAIILDIMLPRLSGFEVCRTLRARGIETPILILTARSQEGDKILGEFRSMGLRPYTLEKAKQFGFDQPYLEACL